MDGHDFEFKEFGISIAVGWRFSVLILLFVPSKGAVEMSSLQCEAFKSFSVWGFYLMIGILIGLARWFVLP